MTEKRIDDYCFNFEDQLGEGSYGQVFKGKNEKTKQIVAIKMLNKDIIDNDEYLKQGLMSEIQVMQKLNSQNIVAFLEIMETNNNYYIIQEYCDGGDLEGLIKKKKLLKEEEALKVLQDILTGFIQLIKNGIIHRDLKPANILINQGIFKLADFGFAKVVEYFKKQMLESIVGTPLYMSPQILAQEKYTSKSDIWSIGFIYYEMLFGQPPWTARSPTDLLRNINKYPIKFFNQRNPISELSKDFIQQCLQIEEAKRIGWDEIYFHPLFNDYFLDKINQKEKLEDKTTYLIRDLRSRISVKNIDINQLFEQLNYQAGSTLTIKEFGQFFLLIDQAMSKEEIEYIFNSIDTDNDNFIVFEEFKNWLEKNQVKIFIKNTKVPQSIESIQSKLFEKTIDIKLEKGKILEINKYFRTNIQERIDYILAKLKKSIEKYQLNLGDVFKKYDKSKDNLLDEEELMLMLQRIEPEITAVENQQIFYMFDINKDGQITLQEFINLINGLDLKNSVQINQMYQEFQ